MSDDVQRPATRSGPLSPCGHPVAAFVDHPGWGWCSVCAQQAEAALPPPHPSRRVPAGEGDDAQEAAVIHFVKGLAPGHTPLCGAESSMGSILPRLVTCPACQRLLERPPQAHNG